MERRTRRYDRRKTWQHSDTARDEQTERYSSMPESRDDDNDPPSVPSRVG